MILSIISSVFEIVEFSFHHAFIKLCHVVLPFAFAVHLLAAPSMGLLVGIISWIACASWRDLRTAWFARITCPRHEKLSLYFFFWHASNFTNPVKLSLCCNVEYARSVTSPESDGFVGYAVLGLN
jgi:hypothetical protein